MNWVFYEVIIYFFLIAVGAFLIETGVRWKTPARRPPEAGPLASLSPRGDPLRLRSGPLAESPEQSRRGKGVFKRRRLAGIVVFLFSAAWLTIFFGSFVEPRTLVVRAYEADIGSADGQSVRAAVVSDLHLGPYKGESWTRSVVDRINAEQPDVIFLLGDFVSDRVEAAEGLAPLVDLAAPYGVYAVTGNHEYQSGGAQTIVEKLRALRMTVLQNTSTRLHISGKEVTLVGVDDIWFEGNPYAAMKGLTAEDTVVLLSHNPDIVYSPDAHLADLILAGHTHGGQIRLPILGPIAEIPTALGQVYDKGMFTFEGIPLFITSGLGETGPRARLFNPPEISMVTIKF